MLEGGTIAAQQQLTTYKVKVQNLRKNLTLVSLGAWQASDSTGQNTSKLTRLSPAHLQSQGSEFEEKPHSEQLGCLASLKNTQSQ